MADPAAFTKFVPGLDFLQGLVKRGAGGVPSMSQWIAPTLDPAEIDKRIGELRTVQFWLEQNAKLIAASIQALEVQRMTLSTLQTMNLPLSALREAMTLTPPSADAFAAAAAVPAAAPAGRAAPAGSRDDAHEADRSDDAPDDDEPPQAAPRAARATGAARGSRKARAGGAKAGAAASGIDPMQWWGALTQQFGELAARAIKDVPGLSAAADAVAAARTGPDAAGGAHAGDAGAAAAPRAARSRAGGAGASAKSGKRPSAGARSAAGKGGTGGKGGKGGKGGTKGRVRARRARTDARR